MRSTDDTYRISVDLREVNAHSMQALRLLLVADVLRRFLEVLQQRQVLLALLDQHTAPLAAAGGLWIREPSTRVASPDEAETTLGGPSAIALEPAHSRPDTDSGLTQLRMQVGAVTPPAHAQDSLTSVLGNHDPAALRLVLLRFSPASPAALSAARLHRAEETIQRWRYKVAMWADMPSAPLVADSVSAARDALAADLDTITVLTDLHRLEVDPQIASGSKFQTFAYLDRVLGLDLRHLVGKLHR